MDLTNTQFVFEGKLKRNLLIGVGIGVLCLALSAVGDDQFLTRFWSNYLHNALFFTGIAFTAMFFMCAQFTAFAGWMTVIKRIWEAMSQFMLVGFVLMAVVAIGVWGHFHHLYHWNTPGLDDPASPLFDKIIAGKKGFLNPGFYTLATLGILAIWIFWARGYRKASVDQDTLETESWDYYKKQRKWAASFLPLGGFLSAVFLWQTLMSIDSHWYSTMFAWYSTISVLLAAISLHIMLIIYLKSKGYLEYVSREHLHDIGKYMFGLSVFWTYLWFDQFMLIWYANNGEETIYFNERMLHYPVLFWGNLLLNFITPFFVLMRNDTKRKFGTMFFASLIVFFGHWWDYFYMVKPGVRIAAHEASMIHTGTHGSFQQDDVAPLSSLTGEKLPVALAGVQDAPGGAGQEAAKPQESAIQGTEAKPAGAEPAAAHGEGHAAPAAAQEGDHGAEAAHGEEHAAGDEHGDKSFKLGFTIPGLPELGVMIGFLSLFLFFFFSNLEKASLVPLRDPYLEESLHHHTGVMIDSEQDEHGGHDEEHH